MPNRPLESFDRISQFVSLFDRYFILDFRPFVSNLFVHNRMFEPFIAILIMPWSVLMFLYIVDDEFRVI